ncbi:MAG: inositol monophosphatase family protein [Flammeovirgaceae bacterium]
MANTNWYKYLEKGIEAVKAGGLVLNDTSLHKMEIKEDGSPVTAADKAVEKKIRDILIPTFTECGFEGEEYETVRPNASLRWLCDPIDGTWSFLNKENTAATSLSLFEDGVPKLAIIYNPFTQELYTGCEGISPTLNQKPLPRKTRINLAEGLLNFHVHASQTDLICQIYDWWHQEKFAKVVSQGGSVAYGMAKVAEGIHSVYLGKTRKRSNLWDLGAGIFLIRSIGGKVTDRNGNDIYTSESNQLMIACTEAAIHEEMLQLLSELPE